jgi:ubiquinone/menaquinone biosynthesis C-methylase UbiE
MMYRLALAVTLLGCGGPQAQAPASMPASHTASGPASHPTSHPASQGIHPAKGHRDHPNAHGHHRFTDAAHWAKRFDAPERDAWQKPDAVIAALKLAPTARVADIGAGTGYFTVRLAKAVPQGMVVGADIEPNMVAHIAARAKAAGLTNVSAQQAPADAPGLTEPADLLFICNTWHHVGARAAWLKAAKAQLKTGGRIAILDYKPELDCPGPPRQMRLSVDQVVAEMAAAGFVLAEKHVDLLPRQYLLTFTAKVTAPQ